MSELVRLPNGSWIDPAGVRSIRRTAEHKNVPGNIDNPPWVTVVGANGEHFTSEFKTDSEAQNWADEFARIVNAAKTSLLPERAKDTAPFVTDFRALKK